KVKKKIILQKPTIMLNLSRLIKLMILGSKYKKEKEELRLFSKASKSRLMKDLMEEYDDRPEESAIIGSTQNNQNNDNAELEEKLRYEEENFIRLNISKKDLKLSKN